MISVHEVPVPDEPVRLPVELIVRESCGGRAQPGAQPGAQKTATDQEDS